VAFQTDKAGNQEHNPPVFDHGNLTKMFVMFNSSRYPEIDYDGTKMDNIRNRVNIRLVNNKKSLKKLVAKLCFSHRTIFDENLAACIGKKQNVLSTNPYILGWRSSISGRP